MTPNKRDLKAYSRFDGTGRIVPGSTVLRRNKPKNGNWKEVQAYECCVPSTETSYRCCIAIQAVADSETGLYGFTLDTKNNGGPNLTGSIQWTSTVSESFSLAAGGSYDFEYDLEGVIPHTVYLCIDNPSQLQDFEIGFGPGNSVAISNLYQLEGIDEWDGDNMEFNSLDFTGITTITQLYNIGTGLVHINITGCVNLNDLEVMDNALTEASVDHILITLDDNGLSNGYVELVGGTNAVPSAAGLLAKTSLEGKGWDVIVNV
jgi:hypothetical protein